MRSFWSTIAIVAALLAAPPAFAERITVSVDVSRLDPQTFEDLDALGLEKKVVVRLIQEGFAVVAASEDAHVRVQYFAGPELRIAVSSGSVDRERALPLVVPVDLDPLHLEIAQKTVELVRQMPEPISPAVPSETSIEEPSPIAPRLPDARLSVEGMVGAVFRGQADFQLGVGMEYRLLPRLIGTGTLGFVPASATEIDVFEWQAQLGLAWVPIRSSTSRLTVGLSLGALVHHFAREGESGSRGDILFSVPVLLRRALSERLAAALRIAPGFSDQAREHTQAGRQIWQRSSARLEVLGQLSWCL